jgi:hypothetical protein
MISTAKVGPRAYIAQRPHPFSILSLPLEVTMANRAMDAKVKRAREQRQALGMAEGNKPAYHTNKPLLRLIASNAQHMVKSASKPVDAYVTPLTVLYNPRQPQHKLPVMWAAMASCDSELVRKADYLRK